MKERWTPLKYTTAPRRGFWWGLILKIQPFWENCSHGFDVLRFWLNTVKETPNYLSEPQEPGTSKLDWRYFEHNTFDRNELQVLKNLHKGTGTIWQKKKTIFVPVPLRNFLRTWSSFLSTLLFSKYLQSNFEVPGPCGSLGLVGG